MNHRTYLFLSTSLKQRFHSLFKARARLVYYRAHIICSAEPRDLCSGVAYLVPKGCVSVRVTLTWDILREIDD